MLHLTTNEGILICVVVVAISALMQAIMTTVAALGLLGMKKRIQALTERVEEDVLPAVKTARGIVDEASPKLKLATDEVLEISRAVRLQVDHVNATLTDIVDKTHKQANRVDECITLVMSGLGRASGKVQRATGGTSRKLNAVVTGIRVGTEVFRARRKARQDVQAK